jgi:hypothetical protein
MCSPHAGLLLPSVLLSILKWGNAIPCGARTILKQQSALPRSEIPIPRGTAFAIVEAGGIRAAFGN